MNHFPAIALLVIVIASASCLEDFESGERDARVYKDFHPFPDVSFFRNVASGDFDSSDESNREPLNLDYVEGSFPTSKDRPSGSVPITGGFGDTSNLFQHHFGGIFSGFNGGNAFHPFDSFGTFGFGPVNNYKPWYKGEHVCTTREETSEGDEQLPENDTNLELSSGFPHFSLNVESCSESSTKHICRRITNQGGIKKTVTTTSSCCYGFKRGRSGFCEQFALKTMKEIGDELNAKQFINSVEKNELQDMMDSNVTIFMPADETFMALSQNLADNHLDVAPLQKNRLDDSDLTMKDVLLNHMVQGLIDIEEIDNEQILTSEFDNRTIRMNVFPKIRRSNQEDDSFRYLYTANCVPIVKANKFAQNGMVHKIDGVLMPVKRNIMEIIRSRDDMNILTTVLEKTKMDKLLDGSSEGDGESKEETKQFSIFAPTDSAFEKLDPQLKRKLKEGTACAENILKNHIMDLTFCSSAVVDEEAKVSAYNMLGEKMIFERDNEDDHKATNEIRSEPQVNAGAPILINEKARMLERDLMGTNGVVHIIDSVLETQTGYPISTMLGSRNLTVFKKLLEYGSFDNYFDNLDNVTYFVPSDSAFESSDAGKYWMKQLDESPQKLKNNEKLKQFLEYHVAQPLTKSCELSEKMIPTLMNEPLRVNLYSTMPTFASNVMNRATVNCARLIHFDQGSCGSVLHQVDKVLSPPAGNLMEMLQSNPQYSRFLKLVEKANLTSLLEESTDKGYTVFVPRDEIIAEVDDWLKEKTDDELEEIVKNHFVSEVVCCAGIVKNEWPFTRTVSTISKNQLILTRNRRPVVQNAAITKCDQIADNGILHEINDVINVQPRRQPANNFYNTFFNQPFFFK